MTTYPALNLHTLAIAIIASMTQDEINSTRHAIKGTDRDIALFILDDAREICSESLAPLFFDTDSLGGTEYDDIDSEMIALIDSPAMIDYIETALRRFA